MAGGTRDSRNAGTNSIQLGNQARAAGQNSIAFGAGARVTGENTEESILTRDKNNGVAIGYSATAAGLNTTVLGAAAKAQGDNATALGQGTLVTADNSVALGAGSCVTADDIRDSDTNGVVSVGKSDGERRIINVADGVNDSDAATVGQISKITGMDSEKGNVVQYDGEDKSVVTFAGENGTKLQNVGDIQIGNAQSTFVGSGLVNGKVYDTEKGQWAENGAEDTHSMAVGKNSSVRGTNSIAVGPDASVNNGNSADLEQSTAIGFHAAVAADNSTALGANASVLASDDGAATAIGANSQATGANATAIGANVGAGENSVVIGGGTSSLAAARAGANATAIGTYVDINADKGTAIGYGAQIGWNGKNSVALGADSVANEENVVSVGHTKGQANGFGETYGEDLNRRITNVADGKNANDAATVGQISKITGMDSEKGNVVQYDGKDKSVVTFAGENGTKLTNLAAGEFKADSTDAVTAGQLYALGIVPGSIVDDSGTGKGNMALGNMSEIEAGDGMDYNTAIGYNAGISREYVIGKGYENAENSTAIGASARIYGSDSVAVGHQSSVTHKQGVAIGQGAKVESANSVAVGHEAIIKGNAENSIAIGNSKTYDPETGLGGGATQSVASGAKNSTVIGVGGATTSEGAVVLGYEARVNGSAANATAIGKDATIQVSSGNGNVALGAESEVSKADVGDDTAHGVVSIGKSGDDGFTRRIVNVADGLNDSDAATVGQLNAVQSAYTNSGIVGGSMDNDTLATGAVAIGKDSKVHGTGSVAIGTGSKVEKHNSVAIGRNAIVKGAGSVALGASSVATEDYVLSLGRNDGSLGLRIVNMKDGINERDAVTVGQMNELAFGKRSGSLKLANGAMNLADGIDRNTTDIKSLNGQLADAMVDWEKGTQNMKDLTAKASAFAAQTQNVDWNALNSVDWNAVNAMAAVPATMNLAVDDVQANEGDTGAEKDDDDRSPQTNGSNPGEVDGNLHVSGNTTLDGTLNVKGDATFEGNATFDKGATMKGDLNMSGNKITGLGAGDVSADSTDAVNGSQLFDVQQQVSDNRNAIGALGSRVSDLGEEVDSVGAISAALAGLHPLDYNGTGSKFQISAALGTYDGTQAAAIGGFYHFNRDTLLSIGGSTSFEGDRKTAANVGVTFRVGEGASEAPAVQDNETKQQMEAMKQEIEMLKAELEQLKNKDTEGTNDKN
ncbi:YadA-like family protein [Megasphaera stantonii]|uniref:YadA-like family protein n=1 Tax=Megasphaera stantonii TaxID=2144175 RepID=UPI0032095A77